MRAIASRRGKINERESSVCTLVGCIEAPSAQEQAMPNEYHPPFKVAVVQATPVFHDLTVTIKTACELIAYAGRGGVRMAGHSMFSVFLRVPRGLPFSNSVSVLFSSPYSHRWKCAASEAYSL